jgi:hypothetical protein
LEELLPKDHETIHLPLDGPLTPSEPAGFAPGEMIRCDACSRVNPPTRLNCFYCEATLPLNESSAHLRKPTLRQPDKHEPGFNCILVSANESLTPSDSVTKSAELLKLSIENLQRIIEHKVPMPLARTANREEADLVFQRLRELGFETVIVSDSDLGLADNPVVRPRSLQFGDGSILLHQAGGKNAIDLSWSELCLVVSGRLIVKKVEFKERLSRRSENELLDTSQFFSDEAVFDLYSAAHEQTWRIGTNSFDFSCLAEQKSFVANENLEKLRGVILSKGQPSCYDNAYDKLKTTLELVWPADQETQSTGWRRERPGKYSIGTASVSSNELQFTRYSRMRRYFAIKN